MYVTPIERPLALNQVRQSNLFSSLSTFHGFIDPWHLLTFSLTNKYVQKLDKLTLSALRAADRVNVIVSSIFTVASWR
jgi:hypothetical protein